MSCFNKDVEVNLLHDGHVVRSGRVRVSSWDLHQNAALYFLDRLKDWPLEYDDIEVIGTVTPDQHLLPVTDSRFRVRDLVLLRRGMERKPRYFREEEGTRQR